MKTLKSFYFSNNKIDFFDADENVYQEDQYDTDYEEEYYFVEDDAVLIACIQGDVKKFQYELKIQNRCMNEILENGLTCLGEAIWCGNLNFVRYLCKNGCLINKLDNYGQNALTVAAKSKMFCIAKYLLEQGCEIQKEMEMNPVTVNLRSQFTNAFQFWKFEMILWFLEHGCPLEKNEIPKCPMIRSCLLNQIEDRLDEICTIRSTIAISLPNQIKPLTRLISQFIDGGENLEIAATAFLN